MTRARLLIVGLALGLVALVWLFPLSVAVALAGIDRFGLTARAVDGTIWDGRVTGLAAAGVPLGDAHVRIAPSRLLRAEVRLEAQGLSGQPLTAALFASPGGRGIDGATASIPMALSVGPVSLSSLDLSNARIRFAGSRCVEASGQAGLTLAARIGGAALESPRLAGPLVCDGDRAGLRLSSPSQAERLTLAIAADGRYSATLLLANRDAAAGAALVALGFVNTPQGYSTRLDGRF